MMQPLKQYLKFIMKNVNQKYTPCGRIPCHCIQMLDLDVKRNRKNYLKCYQSWKDFNNKNL